MKRRGGTIKAGFLSTDPMNFPDRKKESAPLEKEVILTL